MVSYEEKQGFVRRGLRAVAQTINDALSTTFLTVISTVSAAGVIAMVSFAIWSSMAIAELKSDLRYTRYDVASIRQDVHDLKGQFYNGRPQPNGNP